jgi:hypothetical protein
MTSSNNGSGMKHAVEEILPTIWVVAILTALVAAVPISLARESHPELIIWPILAGGLICTAIAAYRTLRRDKAPDMPLETFGPSFAQFANFKEIAVVELSPRQVGKTKSQMDQLELAGFKFEPPTGAHTEKFRIFRTPDGHQLVALDCDRFSAMLTSEALESFDKTFEKSVEATLLRYSGSAASKDHLFALTDEGVKGILKSDIRGNLATYLSKTNDLLMKQVVDELRRTSTKEAKHKRSSRT